MNTKQIRSNKGPYTTLEHAGWTSSMCVCVSNDLQIWVMEMVPGLHFWERYLSL